MAVTTSGRPHAERLRSDLTEVRQQLTETVQDLSPEDLNWAPNPDFKMRPIKELLQEIGTMEALSVHAAAHQEYLDWGEVTQSLDKETVTEILAELSKIREKTLAYLSGVSEEQLETPIPLNEEWQGYFNAPVIEPEELVRWVIRHEYYHVGQLVTYQWQRGRISTAPSD